MRSKGRQPALFTLGIAGLFLAGFFLLVAFGASTYRDAVESQAGNNRTRALAGYIATCLRANDRGEGVRIAGPEVYGTQGQVLEIPDGDSQYVLRIYQWEDKLVEEYSLQDSPLRPEGAQVLGETEVFQIEERNGVQVVVTDEGQAPVCMRSGREVQRWAASRG